MGSCSSHLLTSEDSPNYQLYDSLQFKGSLVRADADEVRAALAAGGDPNYLRMRANGRSGTSMLELATHRGPIITDVILGDARFNSELPRNLSVLRVAIGSKKAALASFLWARGFPDFDDFLPSDEIMARFTEAHTHAFAAPVEVKTPVSARFMSLLWAKSESGGLLQPVVRFFTSSSHHTVLLQLVNVHSTHVEKVNDATVKVTLLADEAWHTPRWEVNLSRMSTRPIVTVELRSDRSEWLQVALSSPPARDVSRKGSRHVFACLRLREPCVPDDDVNRLAAAEALALSQVPNSSFWTRAI